MEEKEKLRRREPITDTQLLMTITICIFVGMYALAILIWGGGFKKPQMLFDMLNDNAYLIIISCGLTIVMITGSIDISVGGVTALVAMVGVMIAGMFFARGMITIISVDPQKGPQGLMDILQKRIEMAWLGSPNKKGVMIPARMEIGVVIAMVLVVLVYLLLRKTRLGRSFYAVGGNRQSALMLGINVRHTRFMAHLLCGLLSGIAGFVFMMHTGAGNATNATAAEMNAIASSIIGGTLLTGGVGNVIGTFFGVLTLSTIKSIVTTSGLRDPWWQSITTGAMLCFFILLQSVVLMRKNKRKK